MATYYVSTTGDNGNNGSTGYPWRTVNYGIQQLSAGDVLLVRDGIYTENFECTRSGTAANRITIKSENKWGAVLKNASYVYVFVNTGDYVTIQDFEVTKGAAQIWVGIYTEGSYTTIDGNKVHEVSALNSGSHGAAGINTHTGSHSIIRNNYVYDVGWEAEPDFLRGSQGIYVTTPYNEIYNNLVWNISGTGICTYHEPVDHNYIFNNTIFNCYTQGILIAAGEGTGLAVDYCEVRNNILYDITYSDSHYGAIGVWGVVGTHNIFTNNLLYNNGMNYTLYGYGTPVNDVLADPLFINYQSDGTGNYSLQAGSPAINAGIDVGLSYDGPAPDIGAYEYDEVLGTTYYVKTDGVDSAGRNGSVGQEWATLSYACTRVTTSGSIIHINAGTYTASVEAQLAVGVSVEGEGMASTIINSTISGTYDGIIRLYSASEGTNGNQHISGITFNGSNLVTNFGIWVMARSNVSIYDCTFIDIDNTAARFHGEISTMYSPAAIYASGNKIYNCIITNCCKYSSGVGGTGSVEIQSQQSFEFYGNTVTHNQRATYTNGNGFKTTGYINGLKIHDNTFNGDVNSDKNHVDSYDFCIELWGSTKSGIEIYDNIINNNEIDIAGGNTTKGVHDYSIYIHDNWIGCSSLRTYEKIGIIIEQDIGTTLSDVSINNNHIQNMSNPIVFYPTLNSVYTNIRIQCNIFENIGKNATGWNQSWGISYSTSSGPPFTVTYWYIENNTFVAATVSGASESAAIKVPNVSGATVHHYYIRNNIITNFEGYPVYSDTAGTLDYFFFTYNDVYNCGNGIYLIVTPTNSNIVTGNITGNPLFVSSSNFHLSSISSPAYRTGTYVGLIMDYDDIYWANPPSIGAYEFYVGAVIPTVTTTTITNIDNTTATGGGNVTSDGGSFVTARGICYSTSQNPTILNDYTTNGTGTGVFISTLSGLLADTLYYVRAYATNSIGTAYGSQVSFETEAYYLPIISTSAVSSISYTTAVCGGNITDDGGSAVTDRGVCWSIIINPTIVDDHTSDGTGNGSFVSNITGLLEDQVYHVRAYATNVVGTSYGDDIQFSTLEEILVDYIEIIFSNLCEYTISGYVPYSSTYVEFVKNGMKWRKGVRDGYFVLDKILTSTGFDGVEDIDWENIRQMK